MFYIYAHVPDYSLTYDFCKCHQTAKFLESIPVHEGAENAEETGSEEEEDEFHPSRPRPTKRGEIMSYCITTTVLPLPILHTAKIDESEESEGPKKSKRMMKGEKLQLRRNFPCQIAYYYIHKV